MIFLLLLRNSKNQMKNVVQAVLLKIGFWKKKVLIFTFSISFIFRRFSLLFRLETSASSIINSNPIINEAKFCLKNQNRLKNQTKLFVLRLNEIIDLCPFYGRFLNFRVHLKQTSCIRSVKIDNKNTL